MEATPLPLSDPKISLEQIRENMTLMGQAVEKLDELIANINDARWKYEMLSRRPELGGAPDAPNRINAGTLFGNMLRLSDQRYAAGDILMLFTGAPSVEEARIAYLSLFSTYQRYQQLVEFRTLKAAGAPISEKNEREILGAETGDIEQIITATASKLLEVAERVQPGIPKLAVSDLPQSAAPATASLTPAPTEE